MSRKAPAVTHLQVREMAVAAIVDERTIEKVIRGEPVRDSTRERIKRGLEAKGLAHLLPGICEARR